jgi:hypothetical protein
MKTGILRRVLIVSPAFPPLNTPDMQRVRMSLPYYRAHGWEPIVLTVDPKYQDGFREEALLETIPADVAVHRCGALPLACSRRLGLGSIGLRSWLNLLLAGARLIRAEKIDVVFFSNTQFITFTLGRLWRWWLGVPYVIDVQDPWRTDYYERAGAGRAPGGWKYRFARAQAALLEGWSFRRAAGLMSVSQRYLDDLRARYRWLRTVPAELIRFGASETDLATALKNPNRLSQPGTSAGTVRFVYTGAAGSIMSASLRVLFQGLARFRAQQPEAARRLRFEFLGTSYAPPGRGVETVLPVAREFGVEDQIVEIPHRLGHLQCIRLQAEADVLLLLGSDDPAYSPSKLYPYYLAGRPMLGVVLRKSNLETMLAELDCATVIRFSTTTPNEDGASALAHFFENALTGFTLRPLPPRHDVLFQREFLARSLTGRQCALLAAALKPAPLA